MVKLRLIEIILKAFPTVKEAKFWYFLRLILPKIYQYVYPHNQ